MEYKHVIIVAIILNVCHIIDSYLKEIPRDTEVKISDSTFMNCSTSLLANKVQWRHGKNYVYTGITVVEPYNERFSVEINPSTGACNLVIRSVQPSDAGTYECTEDEGLGGQVTAQLIVLDDDPVCKSNIHSDGVIGPNSCSIEPEEVKLSCSIKYHGNSLPVLQLGVSDANQCITHGRFKAAFRNNEVTYTLTMKSTLGLKNSSFICQTTRTSDKHYSCSFDNIHILYVFSSEVTVNVTMNEEVNCIVNTSQSCTYKWKWFNGDNISTESENHILKPKKLGMHRCETTCSIRNKSCSVQSMHATVYSAEATSGQNLMLLLVLLLVPSLAVIGVIFYCWRKRKIRKRRLEEEEALDEETRRLDEIELQRQEEEERQKILGLIATILTKASEQKGKRITGLAILDNELFVASDQSSDVEVYDSMKFSFNRQWTLKELIDPLDIVSCHINKCLYISDIKVEGLSKEIFRVDPYGKLIKKWSTKIDLGQLSVTHDLNVILAEESKNKINEYSPDGQFIREIYLSPGDGFRHPRHALKLTNDQFIVSHGSDDDDLHRVCIVDADGKLLKSFGGKRGATINKADTPVYLSVAKSGFVMVVDCSNSRVLSLDSDLKFQSELLSDEHGLRDPRRILLDESNSRIFVSDYIQYNFRIMIYDLGLLMQTRDVSLNS